MIKTFIHFLFARQLPMWILAVAIVLVSSSWLQNWHGSIASYMARITPDSSSSAIQYQLNSPVGQFDRHLIIWPSGAGFELNDFKSTISASDYFNDLPVSRPRLLAISSFLGHKNVLLEQAQNLGLWRPVSNDYKQIVYRDDTFTFIDHVLQRDFKDSEVTLNDAQAGYIKVPTDLFGGVFLFSSIAPEPIAVDDDSSSTIAISVLDKATRQFLAEVWALDNKQWAYSNWMTVLMSGFMLTVPWLLLALFRKKWPIVIFISAVNLLIFVVFFVKLQWFYPIILPLITPFLVWYWQQKQSVREAMVAQLERRQVTMTNMWVGHLLDEGKPDAALRHLQEIQADKIEYSNIWQNVANGFERNRQFEKSIECYKAILKGDSKNPEARLKIKKLKGIVDGTKTMAIAQSNGELPVGQIDNLSLGRYQISRELGRGAMGIVYEAEDPKIHRKVALKVVHLKNLGVDEMEGVKLRFFREAQAAGKLNHPHIVTVYDVGEEHDVAYIAMDLLIGKPLSVHLHQRPIELVKVVKWIAQAADALGYAHENDIIHRDVKPANMIIEEKFSRLKLTDFGVARIAGVQQTQTGIVLGSPSYMSPEQIRGETLTGSTDIFSLGVTLYQCITGELPFVGDTLPALAYAITQSKQESPRNLNSEVSVSLVRIVNKALQKDPRDRFETATDFANSLNKWVNDNSSTKL